MPAGLYDTLVTLAQSVDLMTIDLLAIAQGGTGKGAKTTLFNAQGPTLLTKEVRASMMQDIGDISVQIERSIHKPCSDQDWYQIINEINSAVQMGAGYQPPAPQQLQPQRANPAQMYGNQLPPGAQPALAAPQGQQPVQQHAPQMQQAARQAPPSGVIPGLRPQTPGIQPLQQAPAAPQGMPGMRPQRPAVPPHPQMPGQQPPQGYQQPAYQQPGIDPGIGVEVMSESDIDSMLSQ